MAIEVISGAKTSLKSASLQRADLGVVSFVIIIPIDNLSGSVELYIEFWQYGDIFKVSKQTGRTVK